MNAPTAPFRKRSYFIGIIFVLPVPALVYRTVTFTYVLVQQHWNPPPPSPD